MGLVGNRSRDVKIADEQYLESCLKASHGQ